MAEENDSSDQPCTVPQHTITVNPISAAPSGAHGDPDLQTPFVLLPSTDAGLGGQKDAALQEGGINALPRGISPRAEWSTLSLPDLDDTSMNFVGLYMEHYKIDLRLSTISNSFFIMGGVCYVILTVWDCFLRRERDDVIGSSYKNWLYISLDVIAPTVYLINSIVDICLAEYGRLQQQKKRSLTKVWEDFRVQLNGNSSSSHNDDETDFSDESKKCHCWHRMRRHAAHRRTLAAAFTFGIAACLAVIAAVLRNWYMPSLDSEADYDQWVYNIECIDQWTDHINIASAIISMTGKRHRPWFAPSDPNSASWFYDSECLIDLGDLLFLIGSLIDALLTDFHLDHLVMFPILSSLFWMIDGFLYLRSDILKATKLKEEEFLLVDDTHSSGGGGNAPPISIVI